MTHKKKYKETSKNSFNDLFCVTQILKNYRRKTKVQEEENQIEKGAWVFLFFKCKITYVACSILLLKVTGIETTLVRVNI